jgi:hypothetical protein
MGVKQEQSALASLTDDVRDAAALLLGLASG